MPAKLLDVHQVAELLHMARKMNINRDAEFLQSRHRVT